METRGQRRGRPRRARQPQDQGSERESAATQNTEPRAEVGDQVATAINRMTDLLARLAEQQGQNPNNQPRNPENPVEGEDRALERFHKFSPPKFLGGPDPDVAESWLDKMIDIFAALNYTEERQVAFAVFQFEGAARSWWNMIRTRWEREQTPRTWVNFTREFNKKFFPPLIQEQREDAFIKLRQGSSSVAEYETQFTKLSKFAPELVVTEQKRIRRFVQGLNVEFQKDLAVAQINTFGDALEKAQRVESATLQVKAFQTRKRGAPSATFGRVESDQEAPPSKMGKGTNKDALLGEALHKEGPEKSTPLGSHEPVSRVNCGYCGKPNHHENECRKKGRKCFRCGSSTHQIANCPNEPRKETDKARSDLR